MTWLLVMISPSPVMITPEPVDCPALEVALISTMLGLTACGDAGDGALAARRHDVGAGDAGGAAVSVPVSSWMPYAVPPPIGRGDDRHGGEQRDRAAWRAGAGAAGRAAASGSPGRGAAGPSRRRAARTADGRGLAGAVGRAG